MSRERTDTGRYVETVTHDDVLGVFELVRGPVVTSGDVADALDCSRETARRKLRELKERGVVDHRKTAGRVVWWRTDPEASTDDGDVSDDDPFFSAEAGEGGPDDVSERTDEYLAEIDSEA
jgi:biotin operon repressor